MADFDFITNQLATGGAITSLADVQSLIQAGITHVINCRTEFDEGALYSGTSIQYLWAPTDDDGQIKPLDWFAQGIAFALPALSWTPTLPVQVTPTPPPHPRVLAHCAAGVNRGPSMAFAIMLATGWPSEVAAAQIRKVRPFVGLAYRTDAIGAAAAMGY